MGITATSTEAEVLGKIKDLAVKTPNWLLNLCEFFKMTQREGEGVRQYVARLKGGGRPLRLHGALRRGQGLLRRPDGPGPASGRPEGQADRQGDPGGGGHQGSAHQPDGPPPHPGPIHLVFE